MPQSHVYEIADPVLNRPAMHHLGVPLSAGEIASYRPGAVSHHRTHAATRLATVSLTPADLAAAAQAITGERLRCRRRPGSYGPLLRLWRA
jgi:hypothetical protein